jgi:hypothetical protein
MTLPELITSLTKAYPDHRSRIEAMLGSYKRVLGHLDPEQLHRVWQQTIDRWARSTPPLPADFAEHRPQSAKGEDDKVYERLQLTKIAEVEKKRLIDRTLQHYAETLDAYAKAFNPDFKRETMLLASYGPTVVRGADVFRNCALFLIDRKAWPLASETAATNRGFAHVELSDADWQQIHEHAETQVRNWVQQKAIVRSAPRESDRQKAQLQRLAEQWRGGTQEAEAS